VPASDAEEASCVNQVVAASADDGSCREGFTSSGCEDDFQLSEKDFSRRWWVPSLCHAVMLCIHFYSRDAAVAGPEISEDSKANDVAKTSGGVDERSDVDSRDGGN
jgi:hypothetical protein